MEKVDPRVRELRESGRRAQKSGVVRGVFMG